MGYLQRYDPSRVSIRKLVVGRPLRPVLAGGTALLGATVMIGLAPAMAANPPGLKPCGLVNGSKWVADVVVPTPKQHHLTGNAYRVVAYHMPCGTRNGARALSIIGTHGGLGRSPSGRKFHCRYSRSTLVIGHNGVCWTGRLASPQKEFGFTADLSTGH
jgi:hypothetical protein